MNNNDNRGEIGYDDEDDDDNEDNDDDNNNNTNHRIKHEDDGGDEDGKSGSKRKSKKKKDRSNSGKDFRFSKLANCHMCKRKNKYVYGCYKNWVPTSCNKFFCLDCMLNGIGENILLVI